MEFVYRLKSENYAQAFIVHLKNKRVSVSLEWQEC